MARPKKIKAVVHDLEALAEMVQSPVVPTPIDKLSVDYSSEGLNNMARKINEIIDHLCH